MAKTYRVQYVHPRTGQVVVVGDGLTYEQAEQAWSNCQSQCGVDKYGNPRVNPDIILDALAPPPPAEAGKK